jgi:cytidyltransferase-like protein
MGKPDRKENGSMIRVYTDMVADLFHYGHVEFLRQVSALGDYVLVGINADDVANAHKRRPVQTMEERIASVTACPYVDEVIPNAPWVFDATWIEKYDIDLVVHGDDYSDEQRRYYYKVPIEMGIFRTVTYTKGISTTEIIRRCKELQPGEYR